MGNVYVFNATTNDMTLILNNHPISGTLSAAAQGSSYKPNVTTIARVPGSGNPQTANFGGQNVLIVSFPAGGSQLYNVNVNQTLQNQQATDLQLYIFYTDAVLVSPGQQQDNPTGESLVLQGKPVENVEVEIDLEGGGGGGGEGEGEGGGRQGY
ncbi:MAG TPA: hypothetical protein VEX13_08435 [Chloroflexia bacterium]|nr:hypothetical protein [Chloroflexia bacterium]